MTDNTKLIAQLRKIASKGVSMWGDLQMQAADALEAAQTQIAGANQLAQLNGEIAAELKGQLLELEKQAPKQRVELDAAGEPKAEMTLLERKAVEVLNSLKAASDGGLIHLPVGLQIDIDVVLTVATMRRVGVR